MGKMEGHAVICKKTPINSIPPIWLILTVQKPVTVENGSTVV
jgi:hypothetical protein